MRIADPYSNRMLAVQTLISFSLIVAGYIFVRDIEAQENVALNKVTAQSPVCPGYEGASDLAVDGNTTTVFGETKPHACTCSMGKNATLWSVDLGKPYSLHNIRIFQRFELKVQDRLLGFTVSVDDGTCYRWPNSSNPPTVFNITYDKTGRVVKFQVPREEYFSLCEVQIFACANDFWGQACTNKCGHCTESPCDQQTGSCMCQSGWAPPRCIACADGYWGQSCSNRCGHCRWSSCDKQTGSCQCLTGWAPPACTFCIIGLWSQTCSKRCGHCLGSSCDKQTGRCQCQTGWAPPRCTSCLDGHWGQSCNRCGHCSGQTCDKHNGSCLCLTGWAPPTCTSCVRGLWGQSCSNKCGHCKGSSCDKQTGICQCQTGWAPPRCTSCSDGLWGQTCSNNCGHCIGYVCDRQSGDCPCKTGWAPPRCALCADLWYGENCDKTCNCRDRTEICNKRGGQCTACPDGWIGTACDQCVDGKYGEHCNQTCNNCRNLQCDRLTGSCLGGCAAGFTRPETGCTEKLLSDTQNHTAGTTIIALAISTGVSIALLVVITSVSVWYFRRLKARTRHEERDSSKTKEMTTIQAHGHGYQNVAAQNNDSRNEADNVTNTGEPSGPGNYSTPSLSHDQANYQQNPEDGGIESAYVNVKQHNEMNEYEKLDASTDTTSQNVYEKMTDI
ncbi:protein draper-like isoform X2 [Gigantopelta aegis]|uniref:protein draper-like isoform X2 n=1 Tax=Gigantopelta aegis TaxID=1735272 RepID=UPI001B88CC20|nr:protein draper-like isoform X2 [Gigantopelta aegis]